MREVKPFDTREELEKAIDNGGRFYNVFSSADDHVVTDGELAKAAGVFSSDQTAFLFLELAAFDLSDVDREYIVQLLQPNLRSRYESKRPSQPRPSEVENQHQVGDTIVVEGNPVYLEDKSAFGGFIWIPTYPSNTPVYTPVPIFDQFEVYELFDDKSQTGPSSIVALEPETEVPRNVAIRYGGFLRKLEFEDGSKKPEHQLYLEPAFYTIIASDD